MDIRRKRLFQAGLAAIAFGGVACTFGAGLLADWLVTPYGDDAAHAAGLLSALAVMGAAFALSDRVYIPWGVRWYMRRAPSAAAEAAHGR